MDCLKSTTQTEKIFSIKGEQHQIDVAKQLIEDKINLELHLTHVGSQIMPAYPYHVGGETMDQIVEMQNSSDLFG
jgi:hypothetical protein